MHEKKGGPASVPPPASRPMSTGPQQHSRPDQVSTHAQSRLAIPPKIANLALNELQTLVSVRTPQIVTLKVMQSVKFFKYDQLELDNTCYYSIKVIQTSFQLLSNLHSIINI